MFFLWKRLQGYGAEIGICERRNRHGWMLKPENSGAEIWKRLRLSSAKRCVEFWFISVCCVLLQPKRKLIFKDTNHNYIKNKLLKHSKTQRGCVISLWRTLFVFSPFSRYGTEKIVFIYNKAQTFTSSGFAFPQKICIFAENFFKYGKDTNKIWNSAWIELFS